MVYPRIASFKSHEKFIEYVASLGIELPCDVSLEAGDRSPLAASISYDGGTIGNRFCILPMEGWDGTRDGKPTDLTHRRWHHFGISGAKLIWGGEAVAVRHDGRANPNQLLMTEANLVRSNRFESNWLRSIESVSIATTISSSDCNSRIPDDSHGPTRSREPNPELPKGIARWILVSASRTIRPCYPMTTCSS